MKLWKAYDYFSVKLEIEAAELNSVKAPNVVDSRFGFLMGQCIVVSVGKTLYIFNFSTVSKHVPSVVAQSDSRSVTYQALFWCGKQTIHLGEVDRREVYNIGYIRTESTTKNISK